MCSVGKIHSVGTQVPMLEVSKAGTEQGLKGNRDKMEQKRD